jgi:putative transposase
MNDLQEFIRTTCDIRELKRALAVQNTLAGRPWAEVASELGVNLSFIGTWRWRYKRDGLSCLSVGYQGSKGYLTATQKKGVVAWIQKQDAWDVKTVQKYVTDTYDVQYKSRQSYYAMLKAARISWKKTQNRHPKADPLKVAAKRQEITTTTLTEAPAIIMKRTVELAVDECHLVWGDACGYGWGRRNERTEIPMTNFRKRQTYDGALNLLTGWLVLQRASAGNKENTVAFLKYRRQYFQGRRMILLWDGASYHRAQLVRDYLTALHGPDCPEPQRKIQLIQFAPYAPTQNPIEDVWLAGKREVRRHWAELSSFNDVQAIFSSTITHRPFYFHKLDWYGRDVLIRGRRRRGFLWE